MDIPEINWYTYQSHENEVIKGVENIARESCLAAAQEEKRLAIENFEKLKTL